MRFILVLLLFVFSFGDEIRLTEEQMRLLGIELMSVKRKPALRVIELPAVVRENPKLVYKVHSPAEGVVRKLYAYEGKFVKKGEVLAELFSPKVSEILSRIETTRAQLASARNLYKTYEKLYKQKLIRYTDFIKAKTEYEALKGTLSALLRELERYGEVKNGHLIVRSPGKGYITHQGAVVGQAVSLSEPLFEIHYHEVLWVYGWAPEEELSSVRRARLVEVSKGSLRLPCSLEFISHEVDEETRKVKVRCSVRNEGHVLLVNSFVKLKVYEGEGEGIVIPKSALSEVEGKTVVFVYEGGVFRPREVEVVKELGDEVLVEGLREGELIAVKGVSFLRTKLVGVEEGAHAH
ncbi:MAG: efflux RND transporter periplasmic adaptor subunit [Aquificae bacterium]|nr:efflux RND transporter periplasmic adaptor subunit [Aquificota bacterium]